MVHFLVLLQAWIANHKNYCLIQHQRNLLDLVTETIYCSSTKAIFIKRGLTEVAKKQDYIKKGSLKNT